ncbi:MAG TPA: hypothetical protein VN805_09710 [Caulobacteraceae bacterium]|nr:hypothetical protein [Caulobacteraceae bacterium]
MSADRRPVVLGFRPHTYWTAAVALAGSADAPEVVERRRITFATGDERMVYHRAAEVPAAEAPALVAQVRSAVEVHASQAVKAMVADLARAGRRVRAAVVPTAGLKLPGRIEDIVRVHARMHAAEGELYRDIVADACAGLGLKVHRVVERELFALASDRVGTSEAVLKMRLQAIGAALGPPWSEDQKLAMLAALIHLENDGAAA